MTVQTIAKTPSPERKLDLEPGQLLYRQRDPGSSVYRIDSGLVALSKTMPGRRRQVLCMLSKGDYFGFPLDGRRDTNAETICATTIVELPRWESDETVGHSIYQGVLGRLSSAYERLAWLGRQSAEERVASFILEFARCEGREFPLKTSFVADYLGLRIETVSRILHKFRRERLILQAVFDGNLIIMDEAALKDASEGRRHVISH